MEWDRIEADWQRFKVGVKSQWRQLSDDHLDAIAGKRAPLVQRIKEIYGITKEEAEKQIAAWQARMK